MNKINVSSFLFVLITYSLGVIGLYNLISEWNVINFLFIVFNILYYIYGNISFTVGWHRYFVHKAFKTNKVMDWFLFLGGASLFIGSLSEWVQDHNNHHKHLNSELDPTDINKGFWYSHLGWALIPKKLVIDSKNSLLNYWHKTYIIWALLSGFVIPVSVSYFLMNDIWLAISVSFGLRVTLSQNIIGLLGSYCHRKGDDMSIDSHFISILCFGEGYQKYHHEYPGDYRNGPSIVDFDPSKWLIFILYKLKIVSDLRERSK